KKFGPQLTKLKRQERIHKRNQQRRVSGRDKMAQPERARVEIEIKQKERDNKVESLNNPHKNQEKPTTCKDHVQIDTHNKKK
ncbi:hypothetical protein RA277_29790, partial [Pseudomonas syringae pv. tagetis]